MTYLVARPDLQESEFVLGRAPTLKLLLVEPDSHAARSLAAKLLEHEVEVVLCADGAEALLQVGATQPDVVVLASDIPVVSGATFVRVLRRRSATPVVLGVGPDDAGEAAKALAAGATACIARPFRLHELLPILRGTRSGQAAAQAGDSHPLEVGPIRVDTAGHEVRVHGLPVHVPLKEFELLTFLMAHVDRVVTHDQIRTNVWGPGYAGETNTVSVHIRRLRKRLGDDVQHPALILTVRGLGYRLVNPGPPPARFAQ
jgi:DNA-binding response OmpR family regulator